MTGSLTRADATPPLDWDGFTPRYFPGRRRHDLEVLSAYAAYKDGREWRKSPARLTLVPNESVRPQIETESDGPAQERLLVAISAVQAWEGEDFSP